MKLKKINREVFIGFLVGAVGGILCYFIYGFIAFFVLVFICLFLNSDCITPLILWIVTGPLIVFMLSGSYLLIRNDISEYERTGLLFIIKGSIIVFCLWLFVMILTYLLDIEFIPISNILLMIVCGYAIVVTMSLISLCKMKKWLNIKQSVY
nr:hypothetical protein [uncultured Methanolobus sp.]